METEAVLRCTICKAEIQTPYKITYRNTYLCGPECWNIYKKMAMFMHKFYMAVLKEYPPPDEKTSEMARNIIDDIKKEAEWIRNQDVQVYAR